MGIKDTSIQNCFNMSFMSLHSGAEWAEACWGEIFPLTPGKHKLLGATGLSLLQSQVPLCPWEIDQEVSAKEAQNLWWQISVKANKHLAQDPLKKWQTMFCLPIDWLSIIFSQSWSCINFWQYNWRLMQEYIVYRASQGNWELGQWL